MPNIPLQKTEGTAATSAEAEIRELERRLEEKKRQFAESGETVPEERELLRGALKEHIEQQIQAEGITPTLSAAQTDDDNDGATVSALKPHGTALRSEQDQTHPEAETIRHLVEIALSRSIREAVRDAANYPYLLDELHDHLVDEYYDKLVQLKRVKEF